MSAHGRRRPEPSGSAQAGPAQFGWALVVVVAALIGGLAADRLGHASLVIAVIVSLAAGALGVVILFRSPARPPELAAGYADDETRGIRVPPDRYTPTRPHPKSAGPAQPAAPAPASARGAVPPPAAGSETVVELLPLPGQGQAGQGQAGHGQADAPWWDSAQGAPAPSAGAKRSPAPDLSTYLASTFIAQCPRCGAFRFDHRRARNGWDFRCESCDHVWTWQPGTPWPPVRVMPGGARPPAP